MSIGGNKIAFREFDENIVLNLWNSGMTATQIKTELKTSATKVAEILQKNNIIK